MLIVMSGLPGTGKTALAKGLARQLKAAHVRIDRIEQALRDDESPSEDIGSAGYLLGYALAEDNLRLGQTVVADSVNPLSITRDAWRAVGGRAHVPVVEVEIVCSDKEEHRRRIETKKADIPGPDVPSWKDIEARHYEPWSRQRIVIDTAGKPYEQSLGELDRKLNKVRAKQA